MKKHLDVKGIKKLHKCNFTDCGKTFFGSNAKRNYEYHQKKHSKDKKKQESKCDFCNKEYKNLKQHKKRYCLENRDALTGTWKSSDIKDPLFVMPKPPIELDWSWRDKHKKERMAKVIPSSYINSVIYSTNQEKIVDLAEANKTLQAEPNMPPGIKIESNEQQQAKLTTSSNLDKEKTIDSKQEGKTLQKSNIPSAPRIKIEFEKSSNVVIGKLVIGE